MNSKNRRSFCKSLQKSSFLAYKITDPVYYSQSPTTFFKVLRRSKQAHITTLRDKTHPRLRTLAGRYHKVQGCSCLNQHFKLARRFGFSCVHFTGSQLELAKRARRAGFFTIYSTHTFKELALARKYRIDLVTFSPIFPTPGKGRLLGVKILRKATSRYKNIIALGGIVKRREVHAVRRAGARGFASIRYFTFTGKRRS